MHQEGFMSSRIQMDFSKGLFSPWKIRDFLNINMPWHGTWSLTKHQEHISQYIIKIKKIPATGYKVFSNIYEIWTVISP